MNLFEITDRIGRLIDNHRNCIAKHHAIYFHSANKTINLFCSDSLAIIEGEKIAMLLREDLKGLKSGQYKAIADKILKKLSEKSKE